MGEWNDGDEVVLPDKFYRRFNGKWYELTATPYDPDNSGDGDDNGKKPWIPAIPDPSIPVIGPKG